jgi:uncharacterized protein (DUF305 family)
MRKRLIGPCIAAIAVAGAQFAHAQTPAEHGHAQPHQTMKGAMMTDADFVPMMIKHHEGALEMARVEEEHGASAPVKSLAAKIRQAQEGEIVELKGHSQHAGGAQGTSAEHADQSRMMEQQRQAAMKRLKEASGGALDHAFLEEMAKHHQMAIDMIARTKFQNAALKKMAQKMAAVQRQELKEFKQLESSRGRSK